MLKYIDEYLEHCTWYCSKCKKYFIVMLIDIQRAWSLRSRRKQTNLCVFPFVNWPHKAVHESNMNFTHLNHVFSSCALFSVWPNTKRTETKNLSNPINCHLNFPIMMMVSMIWPLILFTSNLILFHYLGAFQLRNKIIGDFLFNYKLWSSKLDKSNEF